MGDVFLAHDPNIGRLVAIKTVRVTGGNDEDIADRRGRLLREARAAGKFVHPNVVALYDAGEANGLLYLAFEYVPGQDLLKRARQLAGDEPARGAAGGARDRFRARLRPVGERGAPRHQAEQHPARPQRRGQGGRLRHRQAARPVGRADPHRLGGGQPAIHVARADPRRRPRRPFRHLFARRGALRAAVAHPPLRRRHHLHPGLRDPGQGAAADRVAAARPAAGADPAGAFDDGQGPQRAGGRRRQGGRGDPGRSNARSRRPSSTARRRRRRAPTDCPPS